MGGTVPSANATPERVDPTQPERPVAASDSWARSFGGNLPAGPRLILTTADGPGIVIQFDNDASVEGWQISIRSDGSTSYNPGLKTLARNTSSTVSQTITSLNNLAGFPGTASLAPGALGGRHLEVQSHTVGGLVLTYYSQLLVLNNIATGANSNLSVETAVADGNNSALSVDWDADDRVLTLYFPSTAGLTTGNVLTLVSNINAVRPSLGVVAGQF